MARRGAGSNQPLSFWRVRSRWVGAAWAGRPPALPPGQSQSRRVCDCCAVTAVDTHAIGTVTVTFNFKLKLLKIPLNTTLNRASDAQVRTVRSLRRVTVTHWRLKLYWPAAHSGWQAARS
jgi:hypothetical protein